MTTWTAGTKRAETKTLDDVDTLAKQSLGHFSYDVQVGWKGTTDWSDSAHQEAIQDLAYLAPYIALEGLVWRNVGRRLGAGDWADGTVEADASWSGVSQASTTWATVASSGTIDSIFGYTQPLGGVVWTAVDKDE